MSGKRNRLRGRATADRNPRVIAGEAPTTALAALTRRSPLLLRFTDNVPLSVQ